MQRNRIFERRLISVVLLSCLGMLFRSSLAGEGGVDDLKITVGPSLQVGDLGKVDSADLLVSPSGAIAAFVPTQDWPGRRGKPWMAYRVSADGGQTWTGQFEAPMPQTASPVVGVGLTAAAPPRGPFKRIGQWQDTARSTLTHRRDHGQVWFAASVAQFSDDLMHYQVENILVAVEVAMVAKEIPKAERTQEFAHVRRIQPIFDKGQIVQLADGQLLLAMHGKFKDDTKSRAFLTRSLDGGRLWWYFATMAYNAEDPDPRLPGEFSGFSEPSIALLPDGHLLAVLRADNSDKPPYKPLYVCRSDDQGKTWTKPQPTRPHLYSMSPTLAVLDNGVVACAYGGPGLHIAFSTDNGHTWSRDKKLSKVPDVGITGQIDMVKIGPNKLMAIGGVGAGGTRVFPVTVERH